MSVGAVVSLFAGIVGVAMLFVAVSHSQTASIITAFGNAFSGSIRAAEGN